ncbi:flavodoxin family protein [Clostridium sediminicola]|uniref:flavodoxin family protein n=1 Tax=Clostridium sediminicola TaxID=3114879 RepID=UPI003D16E539
MKISLISGSPRKKGNTEILLSYCKDKLEEEGLTTESINLACEKLNHCLGCNKCTGQNKCIQNDDFNKVYNKVLQSKGLILASPVYVGMPTSLMMAFIQRATMVSFNNERTLIGKIGGAIAIGGEAGQLATIKDMTQFYLVNEMIVVGSEYWNIGVASKKGDIKIDTRGKEYVESFVKNVSSIINKLEG